MPIDTTEEIKGKIELQEWMPTPRESSYDLTMFSDDGSGIQEISLTREEFLELKCHLAEIRGIAREIAETEVQRPPRQNGSEEGTPE
jgi:hypothetical protein